jgi:hypothetical protein
MRPAVDQIRQRLRAQRPGRKIGHSPLGIGDAARPAVRMPELPFAKRPRVSRARGQKGSGSIG